MLIITKDLQTVKSFGTVFGLHCDFFQCLHGSLLIVYTVSIDQAATLSTLDQLGTILFSDDHCGSLSEPSLDRVDQLLTV